MPTDTLNNRRIAKNTVYIYLRTLVVLAVSLYTSRIVLEVLGAEDYGIYTVVGGIIALMGFFQAAQSKSTSRFITYELGKHGVGESLKRIFSTAITIHVMMALTAVVICETIGLWIVYHWTKIPPDRSTAALIVYQFSVLVFVIQLIRIPYDSVVIAHEDMSVFAYFSVIEVVLQLLLVWIIKYVDADSLILYAGMMALSAFVLLAMYFVYVRIKYPIYVARLRWDRTLGAQMLSFSGWTLFGSGTNTATQQGVNLLMNNFVGLVANAAIGLTNQVNVAVSKFVAGFSTAFTPQVIKLYAQEQFQDLNRLISRCSKFSFALCYIMVLPLYCNMEFVLRIWLGNDVPMYTAGFCRMILICTLIDATSSVFNTAVIATGRIKFYQIWISCSFLLDLLCAYLLLRASINPVLVFTSRIATRGLMNMFIGLYFSRKYTGFDIADYGRTILLRIILISVITAVPTYCISLYTAGWLRLISTTLFSCLAVSLSVLYILMDSSERNTVLSKIRKAVKH